MCTSMHMNTAKPVLTSKMMNARSEDRGKKHPGGGARMIISSQIDSHPNKTVKKELSNSYPKKHGDSNSSFIMAGVNELEFFVES